MAKISTSALKKSRKVFEEEAKEYGYYDNYLFLSTLKRLDVQITALDELEIAMLENGTMVEKEYVRDRKNIYLNPAIDGFNRVSQQANNTTKTLLQLTKELKQQAMTQNDEEEPEL